MHPGGTRSSSKPQLAHNPFNKSMIRTILRMKFSPRADTILPGNSYLSILAARGCSHYRGRIAIA
jgi:hypothetical protein